MISTANAMVNDEASWRSRIPERVFWPYFLASLFFSLGFAAYFFLYNVHLAHIGFSEARIGRIAAALSLGTVVGTLPAGYASSRFGIRRTLFFALPIAAGAAAARIVLPSYASQLGFGFLTGATLGTWGVCLGPSVARLTSERTRPTAFSLMFASGIAMAGAGSIVAGHLPRLLARYFLSSPEEAVSRTLLLSCAAVLLTLPPLLAMGPGASHASPPALQLPNAFLRRFLSGVVLWSFVASSFSTFAAVYFTRVLEVPLPSLGTIFFVSQISQCAGVLAAPLLLRRAGLGASVMITQVGAAIAMGVLALTHSPAQAILLYWIYISAIYMSEPALFSLLMNQVPAPDRPQASSWHMLTASLTQSLTAVSTGAAITAVGYRPVMLALAVAGTCAGILFRRIAARTVNNLS